MRTTPTPISSSTELARKPVLVTGAAGMLGWDLVAAFGAAWGTDKVTGLGHAELDVADHDAVARVLDTRRPGLVLNAAAYTNVDKAESEREAAHRANAEGPRVLARECAARGIRLVHFGTDQVFGGPSDTPRSETDPVDPANHYAATKWLGEQAVLEQPGTFSLRVQWLYGRRKDRFTPIKDLERFSPFHDQYGSPSWTREIARVTLELVRRDAYGLFHFAYDDYASWADVYAFAARTCGWRVRLEPRATAEAGLPARRPAFSVLSNRKLAAFLGLQGMGSWREPLRSFLLEAK